MKKLSVLSLVLVFSLLLGTVAWAADDIMAAAQRGRRLEDLAPDLEQQARRGLTFR